jgi:hypothetical protein
VGWARVSSVAAVAIAAAVFAAPAPAAVVPPSGGQALTTFPLSNIAIAEGLTPGSRVDVLVRRNGTVIGEALDQLVPAGGALEINHAPERCWDATTPDILAGDAIEVVGAGTSDGIGMTVADVTLNEPSRGENVVATGTTTAPQDQLSVRLVKGAAGHLEAPLDAGTSIEWNGLDYTATFTAPADPLADVEAHVTVGAAVTIAEVLATQACPQPVALNAITSMSRTLVNIANQDSPITVSGVVQPGITVNVNVAGGAAHVAAIALDGTWTATIPAAELAALPQGTSQLTATFAGIGAPAAQTRAITKDTIAPDAPGATPGPGTYATAQAVTLSSPGASVLWTNGPGAPSFVAVAPIPVSSSQTLRALAVDAAGNPSAGGPVEFAYTINAFAGSSAGAPLPLRALVTAKKIKRSKARREGIRLTMQLASGTNVLRIRVYRKRANGVKLLLASGTRAPRKAGLYRTVLKDPLLRKRFNRGSYEVEVTPGTSQSALATPSRAAFRVI